MATKTAARKRTTPKAAPAPVAEGDFEPVRLSSKPAPAERVPLFYVDDVEYTVPKKIGKNHALRFLRTCRTRGESIAVQELLEVLIGEDGYEALTNCDDLDDDTFNKIVDTLRDKALGEAEDEPAGKGR